MQTREDFYSIANRIDLRGQMFYIVYPYTSLRQDAVLLAADAAKATQEYMLRQEVQHMKNERLSPASQVPVLINQNNGKLWQNDVSVSRGNTPEITTGAVVVAQG